MIDLTTASGARQNALKNWLEANGISLSDAAEAIEEIRDEEIEANSEPEPLETYNVVFYATFSLSRTSPLMRDEDLDYWIENQKEQISNEIMNREYPIANELWAAGAIEDVDVQ